MMLRSRTSAIITHAAGWIIFFMLPFLLFPMPQGNESVMGVVTSASFWLSYALYIFLFYFNGYFLIPKFYFQKKYTVYFLIVVALFAIAYFIRQTIQQQPIPVLTTEQMKRIDSLMKNRTLPFQRFDSLARNKEPVNFDSFFRNRPPFERPPGFSPFNSMLFRRPPGMRVDIFAILLLSTIWALSTTVSISQRWNKTEQRAVQAEADKANAELSFLKAQINPHFLFNTLNNIFSLAVKKSDNTAASIMKLSNIMRYITDEANHHFVPLYYEVNCIKDYIDLQRLRLSKTSEVNFCVTGNLGDHSIPPLLLMTFVENVFKYGISNHETSEVTIKLFRVENGIRFFCQNKIFSSLRNADRTGIGIANAKKRLKHLYPNKHTLNITNVNGLFTVNLTIGD